MSELTVLILYSPFLRFGSGYTHLGWMKILVILIPILSFLRLYISRMDEDFSYTYSYSKLILILILSLLMLYISRMDEDFNYTYSYSKLTQVIHI